VSKADVIDLICQALAHGDRTGAAALAREKYPFASLENAGRPPVPRPRRARRAPSPARS
jgi:hypothetical protein